MYEKKTIIAIITWIAIITTNTIIATACVLGAKLVSKIHILVSQSF